jgi:hypothetical protein
MRAQAPSGAVVEAGFKAMVAESDRALEICTAMTALMMLFFAERCAHHRGGTAEVLEG